MEKLHQPLKFRDLISSRGRDCIKAVSDSKSVLQARLQKN